MKRGQQVTARELSDQGFHYMGYKLFHDEIWKKDLVVIVWNCKSGRILSIENQNI